jgi:hypothetical protein
MKYQISANSSNPRWVDNYVLHHHVTPIHNQLKVTGQLDQFHKMGPEKNKIWIQAATEAGIENVYLEDNQVWIDIPDTAETMVWMLKS